MGGGGGGGGDTTVLGAELVPYVRRGNKGGGPDGTAERVCDCEVVAGGAVGVNAKLQAHLYADEAFGGVQEVPLEDAEV